mgnify:FL=1
MVGLLDAESTNLSTRNSRQYTDLDLFFSKVSSTKDVNKMKNVSAVKRSVRNLVLTNHYEKPFHPEIGSGVRGILFEPMTPVTAVILTEHIENVIENYEPRARLIGVRALPNLDRNAYEVSVEFFVVNAPTELIEMTMMLEVAR